MQPDKNDNGFTLIELVVVIALISIMLVYSIPNFQSLISDNTKTATRWIILTVKSLKQSAVQDQTRYTLHVGIDSNKLWYSNETPVPDEKAEGEKTGEEMEVSKPDKNEKDFVLPKEIKIIDVEFPGGDRVTSGQADIEFYEKGYSDMAIIHLEEEEGKKISYLIEPFLLKVKIYDEYLSFGD